jgi:hypothetical protein
LEVKREKKSKMFSSVCVWEEGKREGGGVRSD